MEGEAERLEEKQKRKTEKKKESNLMND